MIVLRLEMPPKKQPRLEESDSAEISTICRGCQKSLSSLGHFKRHLDTTNCKNKYSEKEYQSLGPKIEAMKKERKKAQKAAKYKTEKENISQYNAKQYQKNKAKAAQWYQENKGKRAAWYQENKEKLALKYQENKDKLA